MDKLIIIIPSYNGGQKIVDCLESLNNQSYRNFKLVIVDNNSSSQNLGLIKSYLQDHLLLKSKTNIIYNSQNLGFAKAINLGLRKYIKKDVFAFLFLNQDTKINKETLSEGIAALKSDASIGACSPKILYPDKTIWWIGTKLFRAKEIIFGMHYGISSHIDKGMKDTYLGRKIINVEAISGCAMFVKKEAVEKIGYLDESYFMYAEDMDYSLRIRSKGFGLVAYTGNPIIHDIEDSKKDIQKIKRSIKKYRIYLTSVGFYLLKHYPAYVFIIWAIKLPAILLFSYAKQR